MEAAVAEAVAEVVAGAAVEADPEKWHIVYSHVHIYSKWTFEMWCGFVWVFPLGVSFGVCNLCCYLKLGIVYDTEITTDISIISYLKCAPIYISVSDTIQHDAPCVPFPRLQKKSANLFFWTKVSNRIQSL